jgi:hypothetical protein
VDLEEYVLHLAVMKNGHGFVHLLPVSPSFTLTCCLPQFVHLSLLAAPLL